MRKLPPSSIPTTLPWDHEFPPLETCKETAPHRWQCPKCDCKYRFYSGCNADIAGIIARHLLECRK